MSDSTTIDTGARLWVVMPAYNEGEAIRPVVDGLLARGHQVVVVDDGSRVPLLEVLHGTSVHLLRHVINLGQGAALQTGIRYALAHGAAIIVTFDADGQHQSTDIDALTAPIRAGRADVALGSRFLKGGHAVRISRSKHLVLKLAVLFTRWTTGLALTDTHNGLRALSRRAAQTLHITQNGMAHASQILQQIAAHRLAYVEVPVTVVYSEYSVRKGQRMTNAFNILWDSFAELFNR
jgi:glycosyltransferase involved in cell wall biosynthesis